MSRWQRGEAVMEQLIAKGDLLRLSGGAAQGEPWLDRAMKTLETAETVAESNPDAGVTLAYEAARFACCGALAQQALRPTTTGGHYAIERAVMAQFGAAFAEFGAMRRRRNEMGIRSVRMRSLKKKRRCGRSPKPAL